MIKALINWWRHKRCKLYVCVWDEAVDGRWQEQCWGPFLDPETAEKEFHAYIAGGTSSQTIAQPMIAELKWSIDGDWADPMDDPLEGEQDFEDNPAWDLIRGEDYIIRVAMLSGGGSDHGFLGELTLHKETPSGTYRRTYRATEEWELLQ